MNGWHSVNGASLRLNNLSQPLSDALPVSLNVRVGNSSDGEIGFYNDGFWGMDVKQQTYTGSFWVRGAYDGSFTASLQSHLTDDVFGSVEIESQAVADDWVEHEFELVPDKDAPNSNNTFAITFHLEVWAFSVYGVLISPRCLLFAPFPSHPLFFRLWGLL